MYLAQPTRAGPYRVLIGTVALYRIEKRLLVAQHHFRHRAAPRSACCTVQSRPRLPLQRTASRSQARPTGASPSSTEASPVSAACCVVVRSEVSVAPLLSPSTARSPRPMSAMGPTRRSLATRLAASNSEALATRAGPSSELLDPVPLCCGEERSATWQHDMFDQVLYPRMTAGGTAQEGCWGPLRAVVTNREGCPEAGPGDRLPRAVQRAGPGQLARLIQCIQGFSARIARK